MKIKEAREQIARIGGMLFDRHLTDACGGNISMRVEDRIVISPSLSGQKRQWQIEASDVLVVDMDGGVLKGDGSISRESNVHLGLHREFGEYGTAVIHSHPANLMVFAALAESMPPVLEANLKFGDVPAVDYAPAHSVELAQNILAALRGCESRISKHAAGVIAPWHGLFLMGKDLDAAFDAVERFDTNARCILMARAAGMGDLLESRRHALYDAARKFGKL